MKSETQEFLNQIEVFMTANIRNQWIVVDGFKMYVRKSKRYYCNQFITCFDIASIEAKQYGTGLFTEILTQLLATYPETNFFIESILNPRLPAFLKRFGFIAYRNADMILIR